MSDSVIKTEQWVLGPDNTPFFTTTWAPASGNPTAYALFVHGFAEHIGRYDKFFRKVAAEPYNIQILAFDQRGHGRTSMKPLTDEDEEVKQWRSEGKTVKLEKNGKRVTGGWPRIMPDIEWFVQHTSKLAKAAGKKLFLWGFSMGGGEVLGFVTRSEGPPSAEALKLVDGVIAGGPLIELTVPQASVKVYNNHLSPDNQVKAGSIASSIGLGSFLIPTALKYEDLSHNDESNQANKNDPLCEQVGSLRGVADMINNGALLLSAAPLEKFPRDLPLLVYHGDEDRICSVVASRGFVEKCSANDKTHHAFKGMRHEVHNELEPTPTECAKVVGEWIVQRANAEVGQARL